MEKENTSALHFLLLQCYSKFGDVIFTMTRFFREKKMLKPKQKETFSIDECCSGNFLQILIDLLLLVYIITVISYLSDWKIYPN